MAYIYNGSASYIMGTDIYKNGVLKSGVTLSNITNNGTALTFSIETWTQGASVTSPIAKVSFDFTNYHSLIVTGYTSGWTRQGDATNWLDIDNATTVLNQQYTRYDFSKFYDISNLAGTHAVAAKSYIKRTTSDQTSATNMNFYITSIIAYA